MKGIYKEAEALAMCVRLRAAGKICPELNEMLGETLIAITKMAARILGGKTSDKVIMRYCDDYDARMTCVYMILRKIDENAVDTSDPKKVIGYFVKIAQSWIRTFARNAKNRERLRPTCVLSKVECIDNEIINVCDLYGQLTQQPTRRTVCPH